jgi:putative transposase
MPWKTASALEERTRFLVEYLEDQLSVAELCRRFGISRKTAHKWIDRHATTGLAGLQERSHAAHTQPRAVPAEVEEWILRGRTLFPSWGPKKLVAWARRESGLQELCAVSTAGEILRRHGLTVTRLKTRKSEPFAGVLQPGSAPNELWCVDFKGHFRVGDGSRCDPLTMTDAASRYLLKCQGLPSPGGPAVRRVFEAAFRQYGLPARIRSDNGAPFSSLGLGGISALSLWWIKLGITPERITPGKPYQNGQHERMHLTLKREAATPPAATLRAQQHRFDAFRHEFNEERPHEALAQKTPAECYGPSPRVYCGRAPSPSYAEGLATRKVQSNGMIYWEGKRLFLGEAFAGEHVGFSPQADGVWTVLFGHVALGLLDERRHEIRPLKQAAKRRQG